MAYLKANINADLLARLGRVIKQQTDRGASGSSPISKAFHAAGAIYMGFIRSRFVRFSRGGGDWEPLAESTLRSRRKGSKTQGKKKAGQTAHILGSAFQGDAAILVNTANLLGSIGGFQSEDIATGIRVGVGSNVHYAIYHQEGTPNIPARPIFVQPDQDTLTQMGHVLEQGYQHQVTEFESGAAS